MTESQYPCISVVIPSFNQGRFIEQTLLSVLGQQYPNLEVLVMDAGSTDETHEILRKYQDRIFWQAKPDGGQAEAINEGMRISRGDILCWLSSDDFYLPGTLLDIARRFQGHLKESFLVYGSALTLYEENGVIDGGWKNADALDCVALTYECTVIQPSVFWTREAWRRVGPINTKYDHVIDWEWYIRASKIATFCSVAKFYSVFRLHPLQKSKKDGLCRRREILEVIDIYAPDNWKKNYHLIYSRFERVQRLLVFFKNRKSISLYLLFCLCFPWVAFKIKSRRDVGIILGMLEQ